MEQPQYNMLNREKMEKEFLRLFRDYRMGTTVWSPLASGILTGKYMNGIPDGSRFSNPALSWLKDIYFQNGMEELNVNLKKLTALGMEIGMTLAQLAIAWCLKNENVSSVILGATKKEQLTETMKAQELQTKITPEIMVQIDQILSNAPTPERVF
jgi:aryl-alcohol dehydrogenase-like predicted oxidoreductase